MPVRPQLHGGKGAVAAPSALQGDHLQLPTVRCRWAPLGSPLLPGRQFRQCCVWCGARTVNCRACACSAVSSTMPA